MKLQGVAGNYRPTESRLVDTCEERDLALVFRERQSAYRARLSQHFYHQHARLNRLSREMALEPVFVRLEVLLGGDANARLQLGDFVDEQERVAVGDNFLYLFKI